MVFILCYVVALYSQITYISSTPPVLAKGFDAFLFQTVTANITCGSPREKYFNTKEGYIEPRKRTYSYCDANDPLLRRPPRYMTDGNISTSWQSTNNVDKAYITVHLRQVGLVSGTVLFFDLTNVFLFCM